MTDLPALFHALADPTRLAIVERLLAQGEQPVSRLLDVTDISAPAISRHLSVLTDTGLLSRRVDGQRRLYSVRPEAIGAIARWTMDHRAFWTAGLDRLETALLLDEDPT